MPPARVLRPGPLHILETVDVDLVADIHPAEAGHPPPAARSDHHNAAKASAVAMAPVAVIAAVIAATHSTTTLSPAACGSFGRDKRGGADGGDGGNSENRLAYHGSLLWLSLDVLLTSCLPVMRTPRRVQLCPQKATFCDCHHIARVTARADCPGRGGEPSPRSVSRRLRFRSAQRTVRHHIFEHSVHQGRHAARASRDNCDPFECATGYSDPGRIRAGLRGEPMVWGRCAERHAH